MRYITCTLLLCTIWVTLVRSARPLAHVERYDVVRPQRMNGRAKRSLFSNQVYPEEMQYALTIDGGNHTIHLEKNRNLIGRNFTEVHYSEDGSQLTTSPNYEDHCYYHGHIQGIEDSSVSVGICSGISGYVRVRQQVYLVEPLGDTPEGDHAVYRQEHLRTKRSSCGLSNNKTLYDHNHDHEHVMVPRVSALFKSKDWTKPITGPPRYVEMFLVVDHTEYKRHGSETKARMLEVANHVDKLYRPLNIRVMVVGLEIWTYKDQFDVSINATMTLNRFLKWRQENLLMRAMHDNAMFVTGIDFLGDTVGLANTYAMCTGSSGAVNQDHNRNPIGVASTIAHEMGHNLGMTHDNYSPGCTCGSSASDNCIMGEKITSIYPKLFSSCSQQQLNDFLERARPTCLLDTPSSDRLYWGPSCGNAFLDPGEECDCGSVEECQNPCCDAATCRLTEGSKCAHGDCCENCQIKQAASLCRRSASECDLAEYCTGTSGYCPEDSFHMNGKSCDLGQGHCYDGRCPSHLKHCKRLFGPGAQVGQDFCFAMNFGGNEGANCGRTRYGYARCTQQNMKCGSIFCSGGSESITGQRATFTIPGKGTCKIPVDEDTIRQLDMVPPGTKCGMNKVCYDNKCQDLAVYGKMEDCAAKCHNNGVCNHKRECHCNPGWAQPFCDMKYSDIPQDQTAVIAGVSTAVVLLLLTLVIGGLIYCKTNRKENYTSKRKVHSTSGSLNPMFQEGGGKGKPHSKQIHISQPTFMESSAIQAHSPVFINVAPTRPPPQPPKKSPVELPPPHTESTAPTKPLPPLNSKQASKPSTPPVPPNKPGAPPVPTVKPGRPPVQSMKLSPPPVPALKPTTPKVYNKYPQQTSGGAGQKIALKPPSMLR